MGLLSNTVSIAQFKVNGDIPAGDLSTWLRERLEAYRFLAIDESADEQSVGWVLFDDNLSTEFDNPFTYLRDHFVFLTLRQDKRKVPAFLSRNMMSREYDKWLEMHPKLRRVPKIEREEIKERVTYQLLSRTLPTPSTVDLVWNTDKKILTMATTAATAMDQVQEQFNETFDELSISLMHPMERAYRVLDEKLRGALSKANKTGEQDVVSQIRENTWLGSDFLMWLIWRTLHSDSVYKINQEGPAAMGEGFVAYVTEKVILKAEDEEGKEAKSAITGPQRDFSEARKALFLGKRCAESTLRFEKGELEWKLHLKGDAFTFGSFKCPPVQIEKDEITDANAEREAVFFERMDLLETGIQLFDSLLCEFLNLRLTSKWEDAYKEIRASWTK